MKTEVAEVSYLLDLLMQVEDERDFLQSKLDTFFTGDIPDNASLDHMVLAKYGRMRILEKSKQAVLLVKQTS